MRGFALNVSNYDPARDPAHTPRDRTTAASDEIGYAADLTAALGAVGSTGKAFVIDTGRNGRPISAPSPRAGATSKGRASANGRAPPPPRTSTLTST